MSAPTGSFVRGMGSIRSIGAYDSRSQRVPNRQLAFPRMRVQETWFGLLAIVEGLRQAYYVDAYCLQLVLGR